MKENRIPEPHYSQLKEAKVIFWDFDGVIKDSLEVKSKVFLDIFRGSASEDILLKIEKHHLENGGVSRKEKIPLYVQWAGLEPNQDTIEAFLKKFESQVVQGVIDCPYFQDVYEYLIENHSSQYFVIVTATPQCEIETILESLGIKSFFKKIYGHPTSKEQGVTKELLTLGFSPNECFFIGDSEKDYNASRKTLVPFLLKVHKTNQKLAERLSCPRF